MSSSAVAETPATESAPVESQVEVNDSFDSEGAEPTDFSVEIPDAPGAEVESPAATATPEAPAAEEFDATTLERAGRLGFSAEEAKAYGSKADLEGHLDRTQLVLDQQAAAWARAQLESGQSDDARGGAPSGEQSQQAQQQAAQTALDKFKVELDPSEYDEAQLKAINGINDHYHAIAEKQSAENKQLLGHLEVLAKEVLSLKQTHTGQTKAEDPAQLTRDVDTFAASLGDEFKDIYGVGDKTPPQGSLSFIARAKLAEEMGLLAFAEGKANRPRSSNQELLQRALRVLHPDKIKTAARKEVAAAVQKRSKQAISRPSGHNGKKITGDGEAVSFAAQFLRDNAVDDDDDF